MNTASRSKREAMPAYKVERLVNPPQSVLRELALKHTPAARLTAHGNIDKVSRNKSRVAKYTYIIAPESDAALYSSSVIPPEKAGELIERQKQYIERAGRLIVIDGYMGTGPRRVRVQWNYTPEGANIAGMQQILAFPPDGDEKPVLRLVYTPDFYAEGLPGRQAILVDLENDVTYVMGPDYFGESKKGILRMLNDHAYQRGGLVMHAGAKLVQMGGRRTTMAILGLSGTGKTSTTFSKQGELTQPIQDDMVVLWPGGDTTVTENGCFAKTFGLTPQSEPILYNGTIAPSAWMENVYLDADGRADFSKAVMTPDEVRRWRDVLVQTGAPAENVDDYISGKVKPQAILNDLGIPADGWDFVVWTQNGRSIIPLSEVPDVADFATLPPVTSIGILNRDEGPDAATPGIVRFPTPELAAAYLMLGETTKTSAAGKDRGRTRSPFTQPFFPRVHSLQAKRFREIAATMPGLTVWMMNTGFIGGDARDVTAGRALKVKIPHSSAMIEAMIAGAIRWKRDPDFGYEIADPQANPDLAAKVGAEILEPRRLFESQGRGDIYRRWVETMKKERRAFLEKHGVDAAIVRAVGG